MMMNAYIIPGLEIFREELFERAVCEVFGVTMEELRLTRKSRVERFRDARQLIMFHARKEGKSWAECGAIFSQDHCTAMHAFKKMSFMVEHDLFIKEKYLKIEQKIKEYAKFR